jgi:hypothetical protein
MSIHTCSYYCDRPACVKAQRDELRQKFEQAESLDKQDEIKALIEDLRLNHEFCPKEVILQAADELEVLAAFVRVIEAKLKEKNCSATNIS